MKRFASMLLLLWPVFASAQISHYQRPEDARSAGQYQTDCAAGIALSSCGAIPISTDCAPGKHWAWSDTNIAQCADDDLHCPIGTKQELDARGNPHCNPIICPGGTSLHGNDCVPNLPPDPPSPPLTTLPPLGFNGMAFGGYSYVGNSVVALNIPASKSFAKLNIILNTLDGTWQVSATSQINPNGCCSPILTPSSGTWAQQPMAAYQYRISSMIYGPQNSYLQGQPYNINDGRQFWNGITTNPAGPIDWRSLPANSLIAVAGINMDLIYGCSYAINGGPLDIRYTLQIRPVAQPEYISTTVFDLVFRTTSNTSCGAEG